MGPSEREPRLEGRVGAGFQSPLEKVAELRPLIGIEAELGVRPLCLTLAQSGATFQGDCRCQERAPMCLSFLLTECCALCFFLIVHVQNEPAAAAAVQVGATSQEAPGHTGYRSVRWAQEVFRATHYHPTEQRWSQPQLCGGDVLCLVGKPSERPQGWHLNPIVYGKEAAGVGDNEGLLRTSHDLSPWVLGGGKGERLLAFSLIKVCVSPSPLMHHRDLLLDRPQTCPAWLG